MLDRMAVGELPAKPHTALRNKEGRLRHEECLTRDGFDGPFTILYHVDRPHTAAVATAAHGWETPEAVDDKPRALARRHYRSQEVPRRGGPLRLDIGGGQCMVGTLPDCVPHPTCSRS